MGVTAHRDKAPLQETGDGAAQAAAAVMAGATGQKP